MTTLLSRQYAQCGPWYASGLRFQCLRCGRCCTGAPGYVWLDKKEVLQAARFLKMRAPEFLGRFCRTILWRVSLQERPNGDCVFFTPAGCSIYPARPAQCKSFPFWSDSLRSPQNWEALKARCPGVGQGRLYNTGEIEAILAGNRPTG